MTAFDWIFLFGIIYFSICVASFLKMNLLGVPKFLNLTVSVVSPPLLVMFMMNFFKKFVRGKENLKFSTILIVTWNMIKLAPPFHTALINTIYLAMTEGVHAAKYSNEIKIFNGNIETILNSEM